MSKLANFLTELAAAQGALSLADGVATLENGQQFSIAELQAEHAASNTLEFPDWRVLDDVAEQLPTEMAGSGTMTLSKGGWGGRLAGTTPEGHSYVVGVEFDAGALKLLVYPPDAKNPTEESTEEPLLIAALTPGKVAAYTFYHGAPAYCFEAGGAVSATTPFNGEAVLRDYLKNQ